MKTVVLNFSPKRKQSNSGYFLKLLGVQAVEHISGIGNFQNIYKRIEDADVIVVAFPLYVDAIPSHMLAFFKELEENLKNLPVSGKLYGIANNGFYEGEQCQAALDMLRIFCMRTGLTWGGGIGIGGGEMLRAIKVIPAVSGVITGIMAIYQFIQMIVHNKFQFASWLTNIPWIWFLEGLTVYMLFSAGMLFQLFRMKAAIRKKVKYRNVYTHPTCCPRFLFEIFANMFWILLAAANGTGVWKLTKRFENKNNF